LPSENLLSFKILRWRGEKPQTANRVFIGAFFTSSGRISASREPSYGASIADAIDGSPLAEAIDAADEDLAAAEN
jgi:hypothetical protein